MSLAEEANRLGRPKTCGLLYHLGAVKDGRNGGGSVFPAIVTVIEPSWTSLSHGHVLWLRWPFRC